MSRLNSNLYMFVVDNSWQFCILKSIAKMQKTTVCIMWPCPLSGLTEDHSSRHQWDNHSPVWTLHSLQVLSMLPVAMILESALHWTLEISLWWPDRLCTSSPVSAFQTLAVQSKLPVITCDPVWSHATATISAVCSCKEENNEVLSLAVVLSQYFSKEFY